MANLILRPGWHLPEKLATPENVYKNRRAFLKELGFTGGGMALLGSSLHAAETKKGYPYPRNKEFDGPDLKVTKEDVATTYNNFYEFSTDKDAVHKLTGKFVIDPWPIEITGLCEKPMKVDVKELIEMMPLE